MTPTPPGDPVLPPQHVVPPQIPAGPLPVDAGTATADRMSFVGGGACIAVSVLSVVLRLSGVLPSGLATVVVVMVMAIGLRILVRYAGKSAASVHRARVTKTISLVGLAISVVTVFVPLSTLLHGGGSNHFVANVFAHLWTIVILLVVVGTARTFNSLLLIGMGLTGFLAVSGIAFAIGRPVVKALGGPAGSGDQHNDDPPERRRFVDGYHH